MIISPTYVLSLLLSYYITLFHTISITLYIFLYLTLSHYPSFTLSHSLYLSLSHSLSLSIFHSLSLSLSLSIDIAIYFSFSLTLFSYCITLKVSPRFPLKGTTTTKLGMKSRIFLFLISPKCTIH